MGQSVYAVSGMTCSHCENAVRGEISSIPGVTSVDVDLAAGKVTVTADPDPSPDAVRAAVAEAGYEVVG
jgi:copper chaperone CopZ